MASRSPSAGPLRNGGITAPAASPRRADRAGRALDGVRGTRRRPLDAPPQRRPGLPGPPVRARRDRARTPGPRHHERHATTGTRRTDDHAHTHELTASDGGTTHVDSGFIVHKGRTYPNLLRLFRELGVATQDPGLSMSVRCEGLPGHKGHGHGPVALHPSPQLLRRRGRLVESRDPRAAPRRRARRAGERRGDDLQPGQGNRGEAAREHHREPASRGTWTM
jgi:hypothetical protein